MCVAPPIGLRHEGAGFRRRLALKPSAGLLHHLRGERVDAQTCARRPRRNGLGDHILLVAARVALGAAVLLTPLRGGMVGHAIAASPADTARQDDQSDRVQDQEDAIDAAQEATQARQAAGQPTPPAKAFNLRIDAPLYYNSNAAEVSSGGPAALEGDPEIELGWNRSLVSLPLKLSVKLRADTDRFANVPQANEDEASGSVKAAYYDANDDQAWAPFASFRTTGLFDATFSPWTETRNDFALGFDRFFNLDGNFHPLPSGARSRIAAVWQLGLSMYVQRRLRTPVPNSTAVYVVPSVTYAASKDWNVSLFLSTRERWFDSVASAGTTMSRRDFEVEPILTIAYDPSEALFGGSGLARQQLLGSPQIALQIAFENRASNIANKSWSQWTVGPELTANWRF
jgi:hypothetical protein